MEFRTLAKVLFINCFLWTGILAPAPIFNLQNCEGGCKSNEDCPANSACIPFIGQSCGVCLCTVGYVLKDEKCVSNGVPVGDGFGQRVPPKSRPDDGNGNGQGQGSNGGSDGNGGGGVVATPGPPSAQVTAAVTSTSASGANPTTPSQGGGGGGGGGNSNEQSSTFDCNKYKCDGQVSKDGKDCSDTPPSSIQCPNLAGGGQCMLGSCLRANSSLSYCLCPYGRQSRTCHVKKTGNCNSVDGKTPPDAGETKGKRFRHIRDPENGAVLARHAVDSLSDCVRLCQWATYQQCRSINFGTINGQKVCELLTVWANKESILYQWLKDDSDWTYVCCFK